MAKKRITIDVKLNEPNRVVKPKDEISGAIIVKNEGKKDKKLDRVDIETVAKGRVARAENKKTSTWLIGVFIGIIAGFFLMNYSTMIGIAISAISVIAFAWYWRELGKKQEKAKIQLLKEWKQEQQ